MKEANRPLRTSEGAKKSLNSNRLGVAGWKPLAGSRRLLGTQSSVR